MGCQPICGYEVTQFVVGLYMNSLANDAGLTIIVQNRYWNAALLLLLFQGVLQACSFSKLFLACLTLNGSNAKKKVTCLGVKNLLEKRVTSSSVA
jgi:hypothetical protein